mmetsp:Transcript_9375/g.28264  ORF Transcript_9375/g.28264 Transcript_9375/m.28264 type:complete len:229 (+) Transcript_9375:157-843(+)|eukprot:CAMPEP_0198722964 /NCGR_PEP_ID=MMETSP1475-20131203/546_1 /TAXON_ID= ORGANISM="Unidentified sp., Strain CCMP1999" /NCGR_SAMPLE_ID=MMETSP1475 /ASSEMBLY_ACC=CAM_ASM_001111 /LENGTH=228 /DNA_ID=CAMNT_0044483929 /DNA_START=83 /DNA_END=769 /DNA_ORIENTATION=+
MSAAVAGGAERRGVGAGPGERSRGMPGARGRPSNLQYVQPQYRAATPLPGGGPAAGPTSPSKAGAPPSPTIDKPAENTASVDPGKVSDDSEVRIYPQKGQAEGKVGDGQRRTDDFAEGVSRHNRSFKVPKSEMFADDVEDETQADETVPPAQATITQSQETTAAVTAKVVEAEPVGGAQTEDKSERKENPVVETKKAPEAPKVAAAEAKPDPQSKAPEGKKSGCCVVQ